MKSAIALLLSLPALLSTTAFAEPVKLQTLSLHSEKIAGIRKLVIVPAEGGKLHVIFDPNKCNDRGVCTKMAIFHDTVEAKVLRDNRPADGSLVLQLTPKITLSVGSAYNPDEHISIIASLKDADGTPLELTMTPEVTISVKN